MRRFVIIAGVLALALAALAAAGCASQSGRQSVEDGTPITVGALLAHFNRGNNYYDEGKYDEAIAEYTAAYNNRGLSYVNKGDYDRAIADYNVAIRLEYGAGMVRKTVERRFKRIEPSLVKSITFDQGKENSEHKKLAERAKIKVYGQPQKGLPRHPHSPWETGFSPQGHAKTRIT